MYEGSMVLGSTRLGYKTVLTTLIRLENRYPNEDLVSKIAYYGFEVGMLAQNTPSSGCRRDSRHAAKHICDVCVRSVSCRSTPTRCCMRGFSRYPGQGAMHSEIMHHKCSAR